MSLTLSVPSKTYLTGEYAVMSGGAALILCTGPRFQLRSERGGAGKVCGIPEGSPAALWLKQREPLLRDWDLEFLDPHEGRGGFGASGAQFILVHAFTTMLQHNFKLEPENMNRKDLWNDYQVLSNALGSGADVLAQIEGGVAKVDMAKIEASASLWPYPDLGFMILRTGAKLPTHLHLSTLNRDKLATLVGPAQDVVDAFGKNDSGIFLQIVKSFTAALRELNLQSQRTLELLKPFDEQDWCLASKGCGAWGADTILVLFPQEKQAAAIAFAEDQGLEIVSTELAQGLDVHAH